MNKRNLKRLAFNFVLIPADDFCLSRGDKYSSWGWGNFLLSFQFKDNPPQDLERNIKSMLKKYPLFPKQKIDFEENYNDYEESFYYCFTIEPSSVSEPQNEMKCFEINSLKPKLLIKILRGLTKDLHGFIPLSVFDLEKLTPSLIERSRRYFLEYLNLLNIINQRSSRYEPRKTKEVILYLYQRKIAFEEIPKYTMGFDKFQFALVETSLWFLHKLDGFF